MTNSLTKSRPLLPRQSQSREVRKLEAERDRVLGRLHKMKATKKRKKLLRSRQTLGRQVVNLTILTTEAVIDGEI